MFKFANAYMIKEVKIRTSAKDQGTLIIEPCHFLYFGFKIFTGRQQILWKTSHIQG